MDEDILLAGPSNTGFTDPASGAALSISQITTALLTLEPNLDRLVECKILSGISTEINNAFISVETSQRSD